MKYTIRPELTVDQKEDGRWYAEAMGIPFSNKSRKKAIDQLGAYIIRNCLAIDKEGKLEKLLIKYGIAYEIGNIFDDAANDEFKAMDKEWVEVALQFKDPAVVQ